MNVRVAINGFGRVGRCFLRSAYERQSPVEIVAVNDVADSHTLAALLRHDSVYGRFVPSVESDDDSLTIDGSRVAVFSEAEPAALPWRDLEVDLVIESTGRFRTRAGAQGHLDAGARKVVITAPAKGDDPVDANLALGVNFDEVYDPERHHIVTNASCTTNCLAPVARVLHETIGIRHGLMTTVQSAEEVNAAFADRADSGELEGILAYSEEPLVATDVIGSEYSAVFDAPLTAVIDGTQVKVVAWYDNEWGYSTRLVELAERAFAPVSAVT